MHIADGILPASACVAAQAVAWGGVYLSSRNLEPQDVSKMGLLASAAFVSSLIQVPVAGVSVHLGLFGLLGVLLGRRAFPVVFAALLFQTLLFQHGGLLSLGVNALNMGAGAMAGWAVWKISGVPEGMRSFGRLPGRTSACLAHGG
ncbi:MAG: energy-coupling factor ABC transporter permease [Bryobacterales bacterium]